MRLGIATSLLLLALAGVAAASQSVAIRAGFSPYRLGGSGAMTLAMTVTPSSGEIPSPLTGIDFHYPANLGIATSGLGTASCAPAKLEYWGPEGCPRDSIMGAGVAMARFRVGPEIFNESAAIGIVAGPSPDGRLHLLISATGREPVQARIVMASILEGGHFHVAVPIVPGLPEGEPVSVISVRAALGGHLTYTERRRGRTVRYTPQGVGIPRRCPRGGFRFSGTFSFADGSTSAAQSVIACPRRRR